MAPDKDASACIGEGTAAEEISLERGCRRPLGRDCITLGVVSGPLGVPKPYGPTAFDAATIAPVRQLPEQWASCGRQIATLERCVLPDGTEKRGVEVTFRESAEGASHPPQP